MKEVVYLLQSEEKTKKLKKTKKLIINQKTYNSNGAIFSFVCHKTKTISIKTGY